MTETPVQEWVLKLEKANINLIFARSKSHLSHYVSEKSCELFVESESLNIVSLQEYSQIFSRYQNPAEFCQNFR